MMLTLPKPSSFLTWGSTLTESACKTVYATTGYENSARSFPKTTLSSDNVFGDDGGIYQLATISGSVAGGYTAALNVTI